MFGRGCLVLYHLFFISSSIDGSLGCFHVLAAVNSAAVTFAVHVIFLNCFFSSVNLFVVVVALLSFLRPHLRHMEVPRISVLLELLPQA